MTTPDRSISGLGPRRARPDASRLIAANRAALAAAPVEPPTIEPPPVAPSTPAPAPAADVPGTDASAVSTGRNSASVKVSVYLPKDLRRAAVAAFKATAHLEADQSWSDMIEKAVRAEVKRRERAHNGGKPFPGGEGKLTPGRSVTA